MLFRQWTVIFFYCKFKYDLCCWIFVWCLLRGFTVGADVVVSGGGRLFDTFCVVEFNCEHLQVISCLVKRWLGGFGWDFEGSGRCAEVMEHFSHCSRYNVLLDLGSVVVVCDYVSLRERQREKRGWWEGKEKQQERAQRVTKIFLAFAFQKGIIIEWEMNWLFCTSK